MKALRRLFARLNDERTSSLEAFSPPVVVSQEETRSLELAWQMRLEELGDWQPTNGWLVPPTRSMANVVPFRKRAAEDVQ